MKVKIVLACILIVLLLTACGSQLPPHIALQFATASPTPFLPASEASSSLKEKDLLPMSEETSKDTEEAIVIIYEDSKWTEFPESSLISNVEIPPPFPTLTLSEGIQTILVLGSDQRPNDGGFRTDVILLLSLDENSKSVNLLSIPRDLYVFQPGYRMDRINSAHARGGFELTSLTFEYNFGFRPDHYILVNFNGFSSIIDSLGGIDVEVAQSISDHRDSYGNYTINAGQVHMDSETALWYVRSRGTSNDFDRTRRQQEIILSIFKSGFSLDLFRNAPALYKAYQDTFSSDMGIADMLQLLPLASSIFSNPSLGKFAIDENQASPWITNDNAYVLLPDQDKLRPLLEESLFIQ